VVQNLRETTARLTDVYIGDIGSNHAIKNQRYFFRFFRNETNAFPYFLRVKNTLIFSGYF
jgi:hypothetical protein